MKFNNDFYKGKYFWLGIIGVSFLVKFPWEDVCTINGIMSLIVVITGFVSIIESMFSFSKYFS